MGDDRVILVPPPWAPDPALFGELPAPRALSRRLRAILPVDFMLWPSLQGQPQTGDRPAASMLDAARRQLQPQHHVVNLGAIEPVLQVLGERAARSHAVVGWIPPSQLLQTIGDQLLAGSLEAALGLGSNVTQIIPVTMQGASPAEVERVTAGVKRTIDLDFFNSLMEKRRDEDYSEVSIEPTSIPTLYLSLSVLPAGSEIFGILRRYAPRAVDGGPLNEWGMRLHEDAGGHEVADKVIPFIQEVIAARSKA